MSAVRPVRPAARVMALTLACALGAACVARAPRSDLDFGGMEREVSASRVAAGGTEGASALYGKVAGASYLETGGMSQPADRTIIRTGSLSIAVKDVAAAQADAERLVAAAGGHVSRTSEFVGTISMTLRIPDGRLNATLDSIAALGEVRQRGLSAEDVTAEVIDLDARIKALETSRDRLRALHERTNTVEEIIAVERELARVQSELDSIQGRRRSLQSQADLSTVQLSIRRQQVLGPLGVISVGIVRVVSKLFIWN